MFGMSHCMATLHFIDSVWIIAMRADLNARAEEVKPEKDMSKFVRLDKSSYTARSLRYQTKIKSGTDVKNGFLD
jgi:hypothetical protein